MASGGAVSSAMPPEVVLRIAVADPQRKVVEAFTRSVMPLITAGPPGTTGYADGRPRVHPRIGYWPCLVGREAVAPQVDWIGAPPAAGSGDVSEDKNAKPLDEQLLESESSLVPESEPTVANDGTLMSFAYARSGDKGRNANIGVIARRPEDYAALGQWLSCQRTADYFGLDLSMVKRYELPKLDAYNFVLEGFLEKNLRTDAQGKALAMWLLRMPCQSLTRDG